MNAVVARLSKEYGRTVAPSDVFALTVLDRDAAVAQMTSNSSLSADDAGAIYDAFNDSRSTWSQALGDGFTPSDAWTPFATPSAGIPVTGVRNQKETGNCWLFATAAWIESIQWAATGGTEATRPSHVSTAYLDYWDWFAKITHKYDSGNLKGNVSRPQTIGDALDSGGSFGAAAEIFSRYGVVRSQRFVGNGQNGDATVALAALRAMEQSLGPGGPLADRASRADGALVRQELDKAFNLSADMIAEMTKVFGADGSRDFRGADPTTTATSSDNITSPGDLQVLLPDATGGATPHPLADALGGHDVGAPVDVRTGDSAWNVTTFDGTATPDVQRAYFRKIQRALHAGVPLPISWFVAPIADTGAGAYHLPTGPADADVSGAHESLLIDYAADLPDGTSIDSMVTATPEQQAAALADGAKIRLLRIKNSWGRYNPSAPVNGASDLYFDYLTGKVQVCAGGNCHDEIPLEDVTLPAGFN